MSLEKEAHLDLNMMRVAQIVWGSSRQSMGHDAENLYKSSVYDREREELRTAE